MKITSLLANKLYDNFIFDKMFISNKLVPLSEKIQYLFRKYPSILTGRKEIKYLRHEFRYDNPFTPVLLQAYPHEIGLLDEVINLKKINSALDIGANIGQWAYTLKSFFPHIKILSLEPNPQIFRLLQYNSKRFRDWQSLNLGIGNGASHKFLYYSGNGSAEASVFDERYVLKDNKYKKIAVKLVRLNDANIKKYRLSKTYDLVKIDVEGAELEVLHAIKNISFKYLTVEVAIKRVRGVSVKDVETFFRKNTGQRAKLLFLEMINKNSPAGNATFVLNKK